MNVLKELADGNVTAVIKKLWFLLLGSVMPDDLANLVAKYIGDEGDIVWNAGTVVVTDLKSGKSFDQSISDGWNVIKDQVPSKSLSDLKDAAGIQARAAGVALNPTALASAASSETAQATA